jgi:predicted DNA-binding transcriptional regulator YafY
LRSLLNAHIKNSSTLLVQGPSYEDLGDKRDLFERLNQAIQERRLIAFTYQKDTGPKTYTAAEPYKLINHAGVWYLAAVDNGQMKAFTFSKIDGLNAVVVKLFVAKRDQLKGVFWALVRPPVCLG